MIKFKPSIFEWLLAIINLINIIGLCFYFFKLNASTPPRNELLHTYNNNSGIIKISIASMVSKLIFLGCLYILFLNKLTHYSKTLKVYIISAISIAFLEWYELYYSSTFYDGEVRDKQGLMFPFLASLMATLAIVRITYSKDKKHNLLAKGVLSVILNIGLYILWKMVFEKWDLWQS